MQPTAVVIYANRNTKAEEVDVMADHERKIITALFEIEGLAEELDLTLEKMDNADGKVKHFIEQEKAISKIKKIAKEYDKIDKYEEKDAKKCASRLKGDVHEQEKALEHIANEADKLDEALEKVTDDDGKVKSFVIQRKAAHQIKKILHNIGLIEKFADDEMDTLV